MLLIKFYHNEGNKISRLMRNVLHSLICKISHKPVLCIINLLIIITVWLWKIQSHEISRKFVHKMYACADSFMSWHLPLISCVHYILYKLLKLTLQLLLVTLLINSSCGCSNSVSLTVLLIYLLFKRLLTFLFVGTISINIKLSFVVIITRVLVILHY